MYAHIECITLYLPNILFYTFSREFATEVENRSKSRIQRCERSELRSHLSGQKFIKNAKNGPLWRVFENSVTRQVNLTKLVENAKIENTNATIFKHCVVVNFDF